MLILAHEEIMAMLVPTSILHDGRPVAGSQLAPIQRSCSAVAMSASVELALRGLRDRGEATSLHSMKDE